MSCRLLKPGMGLNCIRSSKFGRLNPHSCRIPYKPPTVMSQKLLTLGTPDGMDGGFFDARRVLLLSARSLLREIRVRLDLVDLLGVPLAVRGNKKDPLIGVQLRAERAVGCVGAQIRSLFQEL